MKAVFHSTQRNHNPDFFLSSGARQPNPELPERVDALLAGVSAVGLDLVEATDHGSGNIAAVHSPEYLRFLVNIHAR